MLASLNPEPYLITIKRDSLLVNAFADSAGGRVGDAHRRSQRSRSAIVVAGQDEVEHVFVFKAWARHCTTDELIDEIFATNEEWKPRIFGIDATGTQSLFADALRREAREKQFTLPLYDHIFTGEKDFRIETTLQPLQAAGKLFALDEAMTEFQAEYQAFPGGRFKDILDALVGVINLFPVQPKPEEVATQARAYLEHLQARQPKPPDPMRVLIEATRAFEEAQLRRRAGPGRPRKTEAWRPLTSRIGEWRRY